MSSCLSERHSRYIDAVLLVQGFRLNVAADLPQGKQVVLFAPH
jgi:hypothetical protein